MIKNKQNNFQIFINNLFERVNSDIFINILSFLFPICETSDVKDSEDGLKKLIKKNYVMISNELSKLRQKNFKFYYSLSSNLNYNVYSSPQIIKLKKISKIQRNIYFVKASFLEKNFNNNSNNNIFFGKFLIYYIKNFQKKEDYISIVIYCMADTKKNNYGFQKIQPRTNFNICFNGKEKLINHEITSILFPGYDERLYDSDGFDIFGYNIYGYDKYGFDQSNNQIK